MPTIYSRRHSFVKANGQVGRHLLIQHTQTKCLHFIRQQIKQNWTDRWEPKSNRVTGVDLHPHAGYFWSSNKPDWRPKSSLTSSDLLRTCGRKSIRCHLSSCSKTLTRQTPRAISSKHGCEIYTVGVHQDETWTERFYFAVISSTPSPFWLWEKVTREVESTKDVWKKGRGGASRTYRGKIRQHDWVDSFCFIDRGEKKTFFLAQST